jgi:hypothetical protein
MNEEELYNEYLKLKNDHQNFSKKEIGIKLGFGNVKRPDMKLTKFIKEYESKMQHKNNDTTHHNTHIVVKKERVENNAIMTVGQQYFNNENNLNILMEIVEGYKKKNNPGEIEIIDVQLPPKYRKEKNEQKSVRVNHKLFKDWDKTLKKNPTFTGLTQSQILNLVLFETMEKYKI